MKCKKCGSELKGEWFFCPDCGARLEEESDLFNVPSSDDSLPEEKETPVPEEPVDPLPPVEEALKNEESEDDEGGTEGDDTDEGEEDEIFPEEPEKKEEPVHASILPEHDDATLGLSLEDYDRKDRIFTCIGALGAILTLIGFFVSYFMKAASDWTNTRGAVTWMVISIISGIISTISSLSAIHYCNLGGFKKKQNILALIVSVIMLVFDFFTLISSEEMSGVIFDLVDALFDFLE